MKAEPIQVVSMLLKNVIIIIIIIHRPKQHVLANLQVPRFASVEGNAKGNPLLKLILNIFVPLSLLQPITATLKITHHITVDFLSLPSPGSKVGRDALTTYERSRQLVCSPLIAFGKLHSHFHSLNTTSSSSSLIHFTFFSRVQPPSAHLEDGYTNTHFGRVRTQSPLYVGPILVSY